MRLFSLLFTVEFIYLRCFIQGDVSAGFVPSIVKRNHDHCYASPLSLTHCPIVYKVIPDVDNRTAS